MKILDASSVFGSTPRHGGRFWWPRGENVETRLEDLFIASANKKVGVIDGPTGAGKTSLAYRAFYQSKVPYNSVSVNDDMDWKELCRQIVSIPKSDETKSKRKFGFSLKKFLPGGKIDTEHETKHDPLRELEYAEQYLDKIKINDIVSIMIDEGVALLIDDFEKANRDLVIKIANLGKALSNVPHNTNNSKLVIVSCRSSYQDLTEVDDTLEGRILHLTLGGLPNPDQSWKFLQLGFEKLGIKHPGNSGLPGEKELAINCQKVAYDATGGILKNLTELGYDVAKPALRTKSIKAKSFEKHAKVKAQKNINDYVRKYKEITDLISEDQYVAQVISYLYQKGITNYHEIADIERFFEKASHSEAALSGVSKLIAGKFLVPTGVEGSRLFVSKPNFALAFCVACYRRDYYRVPAKLKKETIQACLPLVFDW